MTGPVVDETAADLAAFGIEVPALPEASREFEVFPENWDAVRCFCACSTQWLQGFSGANGIDYKSLSVIFEIYSINDKVSTFEDVRIMESAVLRESAKKKA